MDRNAVRVERSNTCGCKNYMTLVRRSGQLSEKCRFSGTSLSSKENMFVGAIDETSSLGGHFRYLDLVHFEDLKIKDLCPHIFKLSS